MPYLSINYFNMNFIFPFFTWLFFVSCNINLNQNIISVTSLTCEYKINPLGISSQNPRLGWQLRSDLRNQKQSAYRVLVSVDSLLFKSDKGNIWDSGK